VKKEAFILKENAIMSQKKSLGAMHSIIARVKTQN
jgi:hypothetical protein